MKKGAMLIEVLLMAIMAVIMVAVLFNLFFTEPQTRETGYRVATGECDTNADCTGDINGEICMETGSPTPTRFCGCFDTSDCPVSGHRCGVDNKCH